MAFVQVKAKAGQAVLDEVIANFDDQPICKRMIFACHSPVGELGVGGRSDIIIWARAAIAERAVQAGLVDWLLQRVG